LSEAEGRNFDEPWQAYAYSIAHALCDDGLFTWAEWTHALGERLRTRPDDDGTHYYEMLLETLEALLVSKEAVRESELAALKEDWRHAYETTPHGKPVELSR
jgi:nitrile hydratase accessory protein